MEKDKNYTINQIMVEDKNLKKFVRSFWTMKKDGKDEKIPKLFPLWSAHILIHLGGNCSFEKENEKVIGEGNQIFNASTYLWDIHYSVKTILIGIELSSQGYYYLTKEKQGGRLNVIEKLGEVDSELDKFITVNTKELKRESLIKLEEYLEKRFEIYYSDKDAEMIFSISEDIEKGFKILEVAKKYNISIRTLERKFKRNTGMTLKKYQLIFKLNKLLEDIYMNEEIDWTDLAIKHGFFDQPHMIKLLKKYLKRSPREYMKARDLMGDLFLVD